MVNNIFDRIANRTRIGFLAAFVLLLISYILTFFSTRKMISHANEINHTNAIIHDLDNVLSFIAKSEAMLKGYIITKEPKYSATFTKNVMATDSVMAHLSALSTKGEQQARLTDLKILVQRKFAYMNSVAKLFSAPVNTISQIKNANDESTRLMNDVEDNVHTIQQTEKTVLDSRSQEISEYSNVIKWLNVLSIAIAILLTLYSIVVYTKENIAKKQEKHKAEEFRDQLENRVQQLADLNTELIELRSLEKYTVTGRIARTIAHEVRNPLTNINLALDQLRSEIAPDENNDMFFEMIARNSNRINKLVSELLNSTRVSEMNFDFISINDLLDESLELAADRISLKHIEIVKNYDLKICKVKIDKEKIKIVFLNLIVNAIEAMEEKGQLTLGTRAETNKCVVTIKDNGKGMDKEQVGRLFEPYFSTKKDGNGLGLANAQNIILNHEGSISAESEKGIGTSFSLTFKME
ncbi:MAG: ATP-binding protein [Ginsengibacter sp.]